MNCEHTIEIIGIEAELGEMEECGVLDDRTERQGRKELEALRVECEEAGCYQ
jgi:hypothetical protein